MYIQPRAGAAMNAPKNEKAKQEEQLRVGHLDYLRVFNAGALSALIASQLLAEIRRGAIWKTKQEKHTHTHTQKKSTTDEGKRSAIWPE